MRCRPAVRMCFSIMRLAHRMTGVRRRSFGTRRRCVMRRVRCVSGARFTRSRPRFGRVPCSRIVYTHSPAFELPRLPRSRYGWTAVIFRLQLASVTSSCRFVPSLRRRRSQVTIASCGLFSGASAGVDAASTAVVTHSAIRPINQSLVVRVVDHGRVHAIH
jgi:hypothetical protein